MQSVVNFLQKNQNQILISLLGMGGFYYLYRNNNTETEGDLKKKRIIQYLRTLYKNNEETADKAVTTFLPQIYKTISEMFPIEKLQEQVKNPSIKSEDKKVIWEDIKNTTISRILLGIYSNVFTNVFLSIQIFMIGRYLFLQYVDGKENEDLQVGSQQEFLTFFADHFPKEGIKKLNEIIENNIKNTLKDISLKQVIDKKEMKELFKDLRRSCESDILKDLSTILLPNESFEPIHSFSKNLLMEIRDLIETQEFSIVLISCFNGCFDIFDQKIDMIIQNLILDNKKFMANFIARLVNEFKGIFEDDYFITIKSNYEFRSYSLIVFSMGIQI